MNTLEHVCSSQPCSRAEIHAATDALKVEGAPGLAHVAPGIELLIGIARLVRRDVASCPLALRVYVGDLDSARPRLSRPGLTIFTFDLSSQLQMIALSDADQSIFFRLHHGFVCIFGCRDDSFQLFNQQCAVRRRLRDRLGQQGSCRHNRRRQRRKRRSSIRRFLRTLCASASASHHHVFHLAAVQRIAFAQLSGNNEYGDDPSRHDAQNEKQDGHGVLFLVISRVFPCVPGGATTPLRGARCAPRWSLRRLTGPVRERHGVQLTDRNCLEGARRSRRSSSDCFALQQCATCLQGRWAV